MKIALDNAGSYMEPDEAPRHSRFHKRIASIERIPNTRSGNNLILECGHRVQSFGDLGKANGVVLCTACRDQEEP